MIKTKICYGKLPSELENALSEFLNTIGWDKVLHISYSQGEINAHSRYSALIVYKV